MTYKKEDESILHHTIMQSKIKHELLKKHCCTNSSNIGCAQIKVVGIINTIAFQKARICAEKLHQHLPFKFVPPQIIDMFQIDWHEYIQKMRRQIGGKMWSLTRTAAVFINDKFIGSDVEFLRFISQTYIFSLPFDVGYYENIATEYCKQYMEKSKRKYVYFTFTIDDFTIGSFVFMLYSDLLPLTCQHFLNLCIGYDEVTKDYRDSYYINTRVHRIVKNGWLQCGGSEFFEITEDSGSNVVVIPDESYCVPHDRRGVLSMANNGKHSNKLQFIICLKANPWMNYYYVAFGQLVDGARTLKILENISTYHEHPTKQILVSHCGEFFLQGGPKMETESNIFLKHQPPSSIEGEDVRLDDSAFDFYGITPWLDNIVDKVDVRDTASVLIAERYLNGLYCLSTDYALGMDLRLHVKIEPVSSITCDITTKSILHELLMNFHPDVMTEQEKLMFISEISQIILAYIFYLDDNEYCLKHISSDTRVVIHRILEIAHKIALRAVTRADEKSLISLKCGDLKIAKLFEEKQIEGILLSESCTSLLQEILKEAILCLMRITNIQE